MKTNRFFSILIPAFVFCSGLFFFAAKSKAENGSLTYKLQAANVLSLEERKKTIEIYNTRLADLGIKKNDIVMSWDGNTINVIISNPGRYSEIKEQVTRMLAAEGHLAFWETYNLSEIAFSVANAFRDGEGMSEFAALFDSTSFKSSGPEDQSCLFGYVFEDKKNRFNSIIDSLQSLKRLPDNLKFAFLHHPNVEHPGTRGVISLKSKTDGMAMLDNPRLTEVKTVTSKYSGSVEISMRMDSVATVKWAIMTKANIDRSIAIVIDAVVLLYPTVNGEITGGVSSITGNFNKNEADQIVSLLKTGPLPSPMKMIGK